jgi:hypothetical protein
MSDFENIKELWERHSVPGKPESSHILKAIKRKKRQAEKKHLMIGICLLLIGCWLFRIGFFSSLHYQYQISSVGLVFMALVPALQGVVHLYVFLRLIGLKISDVPGSYIRSWERYYHFRNIIIRINPPVYFVLLNIGIVLNIIEMLRYYSFESRIIIITTYLALILFAYLFFGRKRIQKERTELNEIITNLKKIEKQIEDTHF